MGVDPSLDREGHAPLLFTWMGRLVFCPPPLFGEASITPQRLLLSKIAGTMISV